jgi:hypothetical protein
MDQPNPMRQRVVVTLVCLAAALAGGGDLRAQDYGAPSGSGSFFSRDLGTAMRVDYNSEYYGTDKGVVAIGGMKVFSQEGSTWLLDAQGTLSDEFGGGFNAGIGYRHLTDTFWGYDSQRIRGVSFWTDGQSTTNDNWFTQLGLTIESLGDKWDARLSTYLPLEREKAAGDTIVGMLDDPFYEGHQLVGGTEVTPIDTALTVVDAEFAHRLLDLEAWAFAGYYHLGGGGYDEDGYRVGFRGYAVPDIQVSVQVSDDDLYGTNVSAGLTWFVGRTHKCNQPVGTILDRFREPVLRNDFIATTQRFETAGVNALTDNSTDEEFHFVHVDANASGGGDGSYENPYNTLDLAETNSDEDDIVLVWSGSAAAPTFTPAGTITVQEGQRWLGEGLDLDGEAVLHYVNTAELGLISLPETSDGSSGGLPPQHHRARRVGRVHPGCRCHERRDQQLRRRRRCHRDQREWSHWFRGLESGADQPDRRRGGSDRRFRHEHHRQLGGDLGRRRTRYRDHRRYGHPGRDGHGREQRRPGRRHRRVDRRIGHARPDRRGG